MIVADYPTIEIKLIREAVPNDLGHKYGLQRHPSFCHVCTNFDWDVAKALYMLREGVIPHDSRYKAVYARPLLEEIEEAAADGCGSCLLLQECVQRFAKRSLNPDTVISITYGSNCVGEYATLGIDFDHIPWDPNGQLTDITSIELFTIAGSPCPWPSIGSSMCYLNPRENGQEVPGGVASFVCPNSYSDEAFRKIRAWAAECEQDHPYCDIYSSFGHLHGLRGTLPRRLIRVPRDGDAVHLTDVPCGSSDTVTKYVALSYCWGKGSGSRLSCENKTAWYTLMPARELLKVHRDTIRIARNLGIQFVWIDALCIVQDDPSEKETEIARMASIYANAYITVSASASHDGAEGCHTCPKPNQKIEITDMHGVSSTVWARETISHAMFDYGLEDFSVAVRSLTKSRTLKALEQYPIMKRGWTFQERTLSPRILHYSTHELIWECLGHISCECGTLSRWVACRALKDRRFAAGLPPDIETRSGSTERARSLIKRMVLPQDSTRTIPGVLRNDFAVLTELGPQFKKLIPDVTWQELWRELASQYSARQLTYASDALEAVSGLAKVWSERAKCTYLAGLWKDDLERGLLWKCVDDSATARPQGMYLAPTWSWVCNRRAVEWITEFASDVPPPTFHADILNVATQPRSDLLPFGGVLTGFLEVRGPFVKGKLSSWNVAKLSHSFLIHLGEHPFRMNVDCVPDIEGMLEQEVFCLWWCTDVINADHGTAHERLLVLKQVDEEVFSRIGIIESANPETRWQSECQERTFRIV